MQASKKMAGAAWTRRSFLLATAAAGTLAMPHGHAHAATFAPTRDSLAEGYRTPDGYARNMYIQGDWQYEHHLTTCGHPSKVGFMEMQNRWKAENWQPEELLDLYVKAGAKQLRAERRPAVVEDVERGFREGIEHERYSLYWQLS